MAKLYHTHHDALARAGPTGHVVNKPIHACDNGAAGTMTSATAQTTHRTTSVTVSEIATALGRSVVVMKASLLIF
jgi:hypothetical protein